MTNQQVLEGFAKTYSQMTDDQLLGLYIERETFLAGAYWALLTELKNRSLPESAAPLAKHRVAVESGRSFGEAEEGDLVGGVFGRR